MTRSMWLAGLVIVGAALYLREATRSEEPALGDAAAARPAGDLHATQVLRAPVVEPSPRGHLAEERTPAEPGPPAEAVTTEQLRDRVERGFAADTSASAADLERDVERGIRSVLPASASLRSLVCRSSVCRVETEHRDLAEYRAFAGRAYFGYEPAIRLGPVFAPPAAEPADGRPVVAVAFIGRSGWALPAL